MKFTQKVKVFRYVPHRPNDVWCECNVILFTPDFVKRFHPFFEGRIQSKPVPIGCLVKLDTAGSRPDRYWSSSGMYRSEYTLTPVGTL